jgi:hypothetical protein
MLPIFGLHQVCIRWFFLFMLKYFGCVSVVMQDSVYNSCFIMFLFGSYGIGVLSTGHVSNGCKFMFGGVAGIVRNN